MDDRFTTSYSYHARKLNKAYNVKFQTEIKCEQCISYEQKSGMVSQEHFSTTEI